MEWSWGTYGQSSLGFVQLSRGYSSKQGRRFETAFSGIKKEAKLSKLRGTGSFDRTPSKNVECEEPLSLIPARISLEKKEFQTVWDDLFLLAGLHNCTGKEARARAAGWTHVTVFENLA